MTKIVIFIIFFVKYTSYGVWCSTENVRKTSTESYACDSKIYCQGDLLKAVQMLGIYNDSKTFVDMKMINSSKVIEAKFDLMNNTGKDEVRKFVLDYFEPEGSEFEKWVPNDLIKVPTFTNSIKDNGLRNWTIKINEIWGEMGRKIKEDVRTSPDLYSLIYVPNPFIVPGGRFREIYYWDSYWIIRGLLLCQMHSTAKGMISNYISMIKTYGLVPNGGRIYYAKRSQPPMLIPMVKSYLDATNDLQFVIDNIGEMEVEFKYWTTNHTVTINKNGVNYTLAVYKDTTTGPRPESYREDVENAKSFESESQKEQFYSEIKSAAESGWDFSSRWFIKNGTNEGTILNTKTRSIVPVDLNALIFWNADILSKFFKDINITDKGSEYENISLQWKKAVTEVLWHDDIGSWLDYDMQNNIRRNYFYPTNISPLWTGCYAKNNTEYFVSRVLKYLNKTEILKTEGGIPTTLRITEQQWDYPNAWPPLQYIMVMALDNTGDKDAKILASEIAYKWLCTNYVTYINETFMFEKYRVDKAGKEGVSTGEYPIQKGFGWTNGIILELMQIYNSTASIENWKTSAPACYDQLMKVLSKKCTHVLNVTHDKDRRDVQISDHLALLNLCQLYF